MSIKKQEYVLSSVNNALRLLEAFNPEKPEMSIAELSRALGVSRSTAFRLLATLQIRGYVTQDPVTNKYRLGLKLLHLGGFVQRELTLCREARPFLETLSRKCGETVHLAILEQEEVIFIDKVESYRPMRMGSYVGARMPAYCTGTGKVLLAHLPEEKQQAYLARKLLTRYTAHTITDREVLTAHLKEVRLRGFAVDAEEIEEGLMCIAAPVWDSKSSVIAAVSVSGPAARLRPKQMVLVGMVTNTGKQISRAMGYQDKSAGQALDI